MSLMPSMIAGAMAVVIATGVVATTRPLCSAVLPDLSGEIVAQESSSAVQARCEEIRASEHDVSVALATGQTIRLPVDRRDWGGDWMLVSADKSGLVSVSTGAGETHWVGELRLTPDSPETGWTAIAMRDDTERLLLTSINVRRSGAALVVSLFAAGRTDLFYKVNGLKKSWLEGRLSTEDMQSRLEILFLDSGILPTEPSHLAQVLEFLQG